MSSWKRQRHPEDVPTPVAVALADFCRRAKAPAPPALIREALALLKEEDDAAVREITDVAPAAEPLGPFAVIDLVRGTPAATAADRQRNGFYELVRVASDEADEAPPPLAPVPPRARPTAPARTKRQRRATVSDKIAPRKRVPGSEAPRAAPRQPPPGTSFLPKRNLPAPRGRFTRVDPSRSTYEALLKPGSREALQIIVEQSATRFHVHRTLEPGYCGRSGAPLTVEDVEGALTRHQLFKVVREREREKVLTALTTGRGSVALAAKELELKPRNIDDLVGELRLKREAAEIKERFVREALDPSNLSLRLAMIGRQRYLADLKIEKRFADALKRDLTELLDDSKEAAPTVDELVALVSKKHAIVAELLSRAIEQLGLVRRYTR